QLSSPTRSIPPGGTSLLPDAQPADNYVLGGSASNTATLSVQVNDDQTMPFDNYIRLETPTVPTNVWNINVALNPTGALAQDDVVFVSFYARGEPAQGTATVQANAYLQENGTNNKLVTIPISGHTQWQHFSTKIEVGSSVGNGGYKFVIHAGFAEQVLEIGGLEIQNYGRLGHRLSDYTVTVQDKFGNPLPEATLDVQMTNHGFKFGTQVRDQLYAITEEEFNALNDTQRRALTPDLEDNFNIPRFIPTWTDVLNHRNAVLDTFNHVVPTTGLQWVAIENSGTSVPEAAVNRATADGQSVTAASVVWQKDRWPTPEAYRSASSPNAQAFHDALIDARLGPSSVLQQFSETGSSPEIDDWKLLNEPLHENYYQQVFVDAGIYTSEVEALADYFLRADAVRPDVTLSINEYAVINSQNDDFAIQYRDLIQSLLDAGAPIDRIGIQAHIARNDITKEDIIRRLDILSETGLPIEISEFDMRDDADTPQLNAAEQERMFRDILQASFAHPSVDGFIMWGVWDKVHWRGNAPLFDSDWNVKPEAAPWFDLVHGQWKPDLVDESVSGTGEWVAPIGLYNGDYQFTAEANGVSSVANVTVSQDGNYVITVDTTASSAIPVVDQVAISETAAMVVGETISISVQGSNFDPAATVTLTGPGTTLNSFSRTSASTLDFSVTLSASASESSQTLIVTNPNDGTGQKVFAIGTLSPSDSLSHRKSDVTIRVVDQLGNPLPDATVDVGMTQHAFRFGTQIRGPLLAVTQAEFDGYTDQKKQGLLPNLTSLGQDRYTPTWQDVLNYRSAVINNFNHIVPGNDLQWQAFNGNGSANPDAAYALAFANGLTAGAVHVVWEKPEWPTPAEYRAGATFSAQDFHDELITDRLSSTGIMNFYSDSGLGVTITDWNVLNEPLHVTHYSDTFETAGIYTSNIEAWADYFIRARAIRPDARLLINDYNILNSANDAATIQYRDLINSLLAAGAPIDRIGLQAHIALNTITKADIVRRLDILAETGLTIEITEFDSRDDADQLTPAQQQQIFQDMLEAAFEHESVDGFIMWGFWDTGHWRGNAPLFDADWNTKTEAAPWFNLVHGDWKPNLVGQTVNANGEWIAPEGLFDGSYDITARLNGQSTTLADVAVNGAGVQIVTIEIENQSPTNITLVGSTIPETASIGTAVGTFETSDPDTGDTFTYSLVSGAGSTNNDSFRVSGNALQTNATFDSSGIQSVRVRSIDQGGLSFEQSFTIAVSEVDVFNDTPTLDAISDVRINEDNPGQTINLTGITAGNGESQPLRITSTSNNTGLIPHPVMNYNSPNPTGGIVFTPAANQSGTASIIVTVEDGGLDNELGTPDDNATVQQTFQIMVLDTIADDSGAILAKDSADNLYVDTQPVLYQGQPVPQAFFGHTVVGVDTSNSANALLLQSLVADGNQPTHRLLTDETWRINGIFNSLQNESSPSLDISGREIASIVNVAAVVGAYEINGVKNPILFVRRGQTYTFNLNTPSHPFYLQTMGNGHQSADIYSRGFSGNGQTSGEYQWVVPQDAPDELFYQCKFHSVMFGKIIVMD
ncbi:MAG: endo-1,4-beta-xylanase, partial [Planctomycetes bacterium]|nr:endo-1,4-beta-xylanase [Planctomycetota bacterium]